jgi:isoleucyl-tRNA synthetase
LFADLERLGDELRFVLITSYARIHPLADRPADAVDVVVGDGDRRLALRVSASAYAKCVRCWHQRADVGNHAEHPQLCGRCVENVTGSGEQRQFA